MIHIADFCVIHFQKERKEKEDPKTIQKTKAHI